MKELLHRFEHKAPEIVFEWHDEQTTARGWVVINSLRGGGKGKRVIVQGWGSVGLTAAEPGSGRPPFSYQE